MNKTSANKQLAKFLIVGFWGLSVVLGAGECQAYYNGAPAYNENYRPIQAHMGSEGYVDLSTIDIFRENDTWLKFTVQTVSAKEDADEVRKNQSFIMFKVNKKTREAWVASTVDAEVLMAMASLNDNIKWKCLDLNRAPAGYEMSSFNMVNICYKHKYGEFLNDSSGTAASIGSKYKGK